MTKDEEEETHIMLKIELSAWGRGYQHITPDWDSSAAQVHWVYVHRAHTALR